METGTRSVTLFDGRVIEVPATMTNAEIQATVGVFEPAVLQASVVRNADGSVSFSRPKGTTKGA